MEHAGYTYVVNDTIPRKPRTTFYMCDKAGTHSNACMARAEKTNGRFQLRETHNHPAAAEGMRIEDNDLKLEVLKFKDILKSRAFKELQLLKVIYDEEALVYPTSARWFPWSIANSFMSQVRNVSMLRDPKTLLELSNMFDDGQLDHYKCNGELIYRGCIQDCEGSNSVVFACQSLIDAILNRKSLEMHVDTSYTTLMFKPKFKQLLTIHFLVKSFSVPAVFCLMENITDSSYDTVFSFISNKILIGYKSKLIITNFNPILRCSLAKYFNPDNIYGSLFIHNQDIWEKIQSFGYLNLVTDDYDAFFCIKMLMALPFLYSSAIKQGFCIVKTYALEFNVPMIKLFTYYEQYWLREIGCESISVHRSPFKTNNNIELFHCKLMDMFEERPTIWVFLDCLKIFNEIYSPQEQQIIDTRIINKRILYSLLYNQELISENIRFLESNIISVKQFLIVASEVFINFADRRLRFINKIIATENAIVDGNSNSESSSDFNVSMDEENDMENNTALLEFNCDSHENEGHIESDNSYESDGGIKSDSSDSRDESDEDQQQLLLSMENESLLSDTPNEGQDEEQQPMENILLLSDISDEEQNEDQQPMENILLLSDISDEEQDEDQQSTETMFIVSSTSDEEQDEDQQSMENESLWLVTSDEEQDEEQQSFIEIMSDEDHLEEQWEENVSVSSINITDMEDNLMSSSDEELSNDANVHPFIRNLEIIAVDDTLDVNILQDDMSSSGSEYQISFSEDESMSGSNQQRIGDQSMLVENMSSSDSDDGVSSQGFCMVCLTKKSTYKFLILPCGHAWLCLKCKQKQITLCPCCRIIVKSFTRILETSI